MTENVIIIGGGPAGLASAIYLARAGLKPLVFAGSVPGGQLTLTSEIENYPGFESILGSELIEKMRNQAKKFGTRIVDENVVKVNFSNVPFKVFLPDSGSIPEFFDGKQKTAKNLVPSPYLANSIIIATGAKALWLNIPSETRLRGHGVSACATCDGFFFRDKTVAVVGGGDTAMEEALTLTKFAKKIYIIHRRDFFRASKIMQERVFKNKKIKVIWNSVVEEISGEKKVEGIKISQSQLNQSESVKSVTDSTGLTDSTDLTFKVDGVFVAIGHKPDTDLFNGQVEMDKKGYILTTNRIAIENLNIENSLKIENLKLKIPKFDIGYVSQTSVKGIFAAGDCADPYYRQAATAAGTGVEAALEVERYLET